MCCSAVRIFCLSQQLPVRRLVVGVGAELKVAASLVGTLWPVATSSPGDGPACCSPHTGSRGHRVQSLPVGTTGSRTDARSALSTRMTRALILYAFSLPDETNRLTPRFEMASRSAASSRVISFPTFVLFLTDCRELWLVCV